ncbi:alpha/beta fold hydrolase [Pseudomonas typographi]|uniref:alpha/beta fold hydrolase n=1 Tax=Pseudomonas typographi TaxID=2715964 RepID=UPI001688F10B|nr:alpha/beta hydrolase [Pseudomonas typographi]MBD1551628.1 alpha/beta hydrolase [Pseudomonas typographi]
MTPLPLQKRYTFEGQQVRYGVLGQGAPMVLVHGTPFSSQVWRRLAPLLAQHYRVYYFDLLGYGQSEMRAGQDVSPAVQNRVLAALLEHWGLHRPHMVAHGFGGATALRAYLLGGCRYATLSLIDPVALAPWGSPFVQHVRQYEQAFAQLPGYIHEAILPAYIGGAAHRPLRQADMQMHTGPWTGDVGQAAFYRQIAHMDRRYTDEVEHRYGEIDCPVQVIWGEQDQWLPIERGEALLARIAPARLVRVPQAGHLVLEDAPEAIMAALWGFLPGAA